MLSVEKRRTRAGTLPGFIWEGSPLKIGCERGLLDGESVKPFIVDVFEGDNFVALGFSSRSRAVASGILVLENCCISIRSTVHTAKNKSGNCE